ncbi:MAG: prenyltransferase [Steroidobacter sp.]
MTHKGELSAKELKKLSKRIADAAAKENEAEVQAGLKPLLHAQQHQEDAALCLLTLVKEAGLPHEMALDILAQVFESHSQNLTVLALLGDALEQAKDIDMLNAPPPEHPLFQKVADTLVAFAAKTKGTEDEVRTLEGLATAARMLARQRDELAESAYRRLVELEPERPGPHYNLGLLYKTRGRFAEGVIANQTAAKLAKKPVESYQWNLGICATGAGQGEVALAVWKQLEQRIKMGRFGLPEGGYPMCKVRLAERPLAERTAASDDPGLEETIWIERLSPCHGIIRSVLYQQLGVDYGDVILMDGAPITYHTYGDKKIPVFPHLATLVKNHYRFFDFAGTQEEKGQLGDISRDLERDAIVYSHTENYVTLCANCWRERSVDHEHKATLAKHVIAGRVAAPPDLDVKELLRQLDAAMSSRESCHLYVPQLCEAAGLAERAAVEQRRFNMIRSAIE